MARGQQSGSAAEWGCPGTVSAAGICARWIFPLLLLAFPATAPMAAQDTEWNRYTLEDLEGVFVRAEANEGCAGAGVVAESVRTDAAALLEEAGVPLLTEEEMLASPGLPEVRVTVECGGGVAGIVGYSISVRVQQATQMIRDNQITLAEAVTWWTSGVGVAEAGNAAAALNDELRRHLTIFAEAFATANAEAEGSSR